MNNQLWVDTLVSNVQVVSLLVAPLYPVLVAALTKRFSTRPKVKAILLILLTLASGLVSEWLADPSHFNIVAAIETWIFTFVTAVVAYKGALKNFDWMKWIQENVGPKDSPRELMAHQGQTPPPAHQG